MSTTTEERKGTAVRLNIAVEVPTSATPGEVLEQLMLAANRRQGVTITLPRGDRVDVDLVMVTEVHR